MQLVKMAFNQRRKTLSNSIKPMLIGVDLQGLEETLKKRAEQLSSNDFINLYNEINFRKNK